MRVPLLVFAVVLLIGGAAAFVLMRPQPTQVGQASQGQAGTVTQSGSAATMNATQGMAPVHSVPLEQRRAAAGTCEGYNLELQEAAGIQRRIGREAEAQRLLAMRQNCGAGVSSYARSAQ